MDLARGRSIGRLLVPAAVALAALVAVQGAGSATSYTDPAGDAGTAPDVTAVSVTNSPGGTITIAVTTNQATFPADAVLIIPIDADRNPATGSPSGIEYSLVYRSSGYTFSMWNGAGLSAAPADVVKVSYQAGVLRLVTSKSALGNTTGFDFSIVSSQLVNNQAVATDHAPDSGSYSYSLTVPRTVHLGKPTARAVRAGKAFAVSAAVRTTASSVRVSCSAKAGGKKIHTHARLVGGKVVCAGIAPKGSAGKRLTGAETVRAGKVAATARFSFAVRK